MGYALKPSSWADVLQALGSSDTMSSPWKSLGVTVQNPGKCRQANVPAPHSGKDGATLGKRADTSSCCRDPVATTRPPRSLFPCRAQARKAERELQGLGVGSKGGEKSRALGPPWALQSGLQGRLLPGLVGLAARQDQGKAQPHPSAPRPPRVNSKKPTSYNTRTWHPPAPVGHTYGCRMTGPF